MKKFDCEDSEEIHQGVLFSFLGKCCFLLEWPGSAVLRLLRHKFHRYNFNVYILLIERVCFTGVLKRLKFNGVSLSMFSNKMSLKKDIKNTFSRVAKYVCIDNCFTVTIQNNRSFTAAIYDNEFVIKITDFISIKTIFTAK